MVISISTEYENVKKRNENRQNVIDQMVRWIGNVNRVHY